MAMSNGVPLGHAPRSHDVHLVPLGSALWNMWANLFQSLFKSCAIQHTVLNIGNYHSPGLYNTLGIWWRGFLLFINVKNYLHSRKYFLNFHKKWNNSLAHQKSNSGLHIPSISVLYKFPGRDIKIPWAVFAESRTTWPHTDFGAVNSMELGFYCRDLQCLKTMCKLLQLNQGFRQCMVLPLKY